MANFRFLYHVKTDSKIDTDSLGGIITSAIMGATEKYDISWNNFESRMSHSFADIRNQEQFLDVTLAAEAADGSIEALRAHKVILSACSPILRDLLIKQSALAPHSLFMPVMLYLKGISAKDLGHVLEFIYKGSVNLYQYELDDFLAVAKSLQIPLDEEENNQRTQPNPSKRSTPPPSSGDRKRQIKRPKVMMKGPKSETNGNLEVTPPQIVKMEQSNVSSTEPEVFVVDEEVDDGSDEAAYGHNAMDELGERISSGAAAMKDTFIYENVTETEGGFECKPCGKLIKHRSGLVRHVVDQHVNLGVKYQCPNCTTVSRTRSSLQSHVSKKHPELKGLDYDQCAIYGECY